MRTRIFIIPVSMLMVALAGVSFGATEKEIKSKAFKIFNHKIVVFRSHTAPRTPTVRVTEARRQLKKIRTIPGDKAIMTTNVMFQNEQAVRFTCSNIYFFTLLESDLDQLSGETLNGVTAHAFAQITDLMEIRRQMLQPLSILRGVGVIVLAMLFMLAAYWLIRRIGRWIAAKVAYRIKKIKQLHIYKADLRPHLMLMTKRIVGLSETVVMLILLYVWLTISLYQFPATIPWATDLKTWLGHFTDYISDGFFEMLPNLAILAIIFIIARWLAHLCSQLIKGLGPKGRATRVMSFDTARATHRILTAFIWLIAVVMAYPYIPGSGSVAFKGMSMLFGLMISLGSTGMVNQIMSGFVMLYSGSIRTGEYVKVGSIEGTVTEMGLLATKVMTPRRDFISVPNAVLVSNPTYNYSRHVSKYGAVTTTAVTIGYDAPWRQVHAMLKRAAENTQGVRKEPEPRILQTGLLDHYVEYTLVFYVEKPSDRLGVLSGLNAEIQDVFNTFEVQIMSPHFRAQPEEEIIIPKSHWFAAPAEAPKNETGDSVSV